MIKLFSEEVEVTSTNLDHNTLFVESFEEVFFGVYEFKINDEIVIAEKVGVNQSDPVVSIPVVEANGNKQEMTFTLKKGKQQVVLGEAKQLIKEAVKVEEPVKPSTSVFYVDDFEEIHFDVFEFELNGSKQIAEKVGSDNGNPVVEVPVGSGTVRVVLERSTVNVPDTLNESAIVKEDIVSKEEKFRTEISNVKADLSKTFNELRTETRNIVSDVERVRDEIFIEFASNSENYRVEESDKLKAFVEEKVAVLKESNSAIAEKLEAHVEDSLDAKFSTFISRIDENYADLKSRSSETINEVHKTKTNLKAQAADAKELSTQVDFLEKTQIELNNDNNELKNIVKETADASEKNVNKALSRLGTVKKELTESKAQFDTIKGQLFLDIEEAEQRIKQYYTDHIKTVEESVFDNVRREEILDVIKNSKVEVLAELNNTNGLKDQLRQLATEAANGDYDPMSGKRFQSQLKKDLNKRFNDEMVNIKRMIELRGGGGGGGVAGSNVTSLSGNWQNTYTTVAANSATWLTGPGTTNKIPVFTAANTIDDSIISQAGSEIVIDGAATVTGSLSVTGSLTYLDTTVSATSALSVVNAGTSPALYAEQTGVGEPIAKFVDSEGGSVTIGDGGKLAANALSAIDGFETDGDFLSAGSNLNVLFSNCQGTVTTAGSLLSGNATTLGVDSGALDYLNQSACTGIDCTGTVTTAGAGLSGTSTQIGLDAATYNSLDQSACVGINCVGDVTGIDAGTAITVTDGTTATPTVGVTSACNTAWNNKTTCLGTITTAGALLSGDATTLGVDSGALNYLNQSACAGINCTGTMTSVSVSDGLETTGGNTPTLGIATACNTKWDQSACTGINCVGDVTGIDAGTAMEVTDGNTATPTVGVTSACNTAWNNKTTCTGTITTAGALLSGDATTIGIDSGALNYLNQSACAGIDCVGTVTGFDSGGDGTSIDASDPTSVVVEVDNTVARTNGAERFDNNLTISGDLSSVGTTYTDCIVVGGSTLDGTTGTTLNGNLVVQASTGQDYLKVSAGNVCFNTGGGVTQMGSANLGARVNIQAISDAVPALAVRGKSGSSDLVRVSSASSTAGDYFVIKNDGKVGIGSTNPSEALTVTGNISATGNFLSGGVNIDQLFGSGSGGVTGFDNGGDGIDIDQSDTTSVVIEVDSSVVRTSGSQTIGGAKSFTDTVCVNGTCTNTDALVLTTTEDSSDASPIQTFKRNSASPTNGDYLGQIKFKGENDGDQEVVYSKITGKISDVADGAEDGLIETAVKKNGATTIVSRQTHSALKLINGTGLEVAGDSLFEGDIVQQPSSSITPSSNGDLVVEATNNTTLTFKLKGSDGTVRSATLTLS